MGLQNAQVNPNENKPVRLDQNHTHTHTHTTACKIPVLMLTTRLRPSSTSTLLPNTTKGKLSGSFGLACTADLNQRQGREEEKLQG